MSQVIEKSAMRVHPLLAESDALKLLKRNPWFSLLGEQQSSIIEGFSLKKDQPGLLVTVLQTIAHGKVSEGVRKWAQEQAQTLDKKRDPNKEIIAFAFRFSPWLYTKDGIAHFDSPGIALMANERTGRAEVLVSGTRDNRGWVDVAALPGVDSATANMALPNKLAQAFNAHRRIQPLPDLRLTQGPDGYRSVFLDSPDAMLLKGLNKPPIYPGVVRIIG